MPKLPLQGMIANIINHCTLKQVADQTLHLLLDENQSALYRDEMIPSLEQTLSDYFQQPVKVQIEVGEVSAETPAKRLKRRSAERHAKLLDEFSHDENVQRLVERFSGTLVKESVTSIQGQPQ